MTTKKPKPRKYIGNVHTGRMLEELEPKPTPTPAPTPEQSGRSNNRRRVARRAASGKGWPA